MKAWLLSYLACQECGGELCESEVIEKRDDELWTGTLECSECQLLWPVLGGVPFLLHDPGEYLCQYRESVLSTLVEYDSASQEALRLVDDFARDHECEAMRFGDDWTAHEAGAPEPALVASSEAQVSYEGLQELNRREGLESTLLKMLGAAPHEVLIEVGPGAGALSEQLAKSCKTLVLVDVSLRGLLRSQSRVGDGSAAVGCILGDAADVELATNRASAVIAANVVDLLDEPETFLTAVSRWLEPRGEIILSSPDPSLGTENDDFLGELLEALDFRIKENCDGIPWLREHSPRYAQIYWLRAIRASI